MNKPLTDEQKREITKISRQFASGFKASIPSINGSGWLIVDPLSAYLNFIGYENTLKEFEAHGKAPQVLVMTFYDGSGFIPAGKDLALRPDILVSRKMFKNWMWL